MKREEQSTQDKILSSAKQEFLEKGFLNAFLRSFTGSMRRAGTVPQNEMPCGLFLPNALVYLFYAWFDNF